MSPPPSTSSPLAKWTSLRPGRRPPSISSVSWSSMSPAADESPIADTVDAPVADAVDAPAAAANAGIDAAVDNDILIKATVLDLSDALVAARAGVLGQARFVVRGRVKRMTMQG